MTTCPAPSKTSAKTAKDFGITGKAKQAVFNCLAQGGAYSLTDIRLYLHARGFWIRETTISARIRDVNKILRLNGKEIVWKYKKKGSTDTVYSLVDL